MFISQLTARRLGICQMDTCLAHASPMDKWFPLTANMAMSWLEIAAFVVLMEDGILLSRNVKVSNSSTSQEKFLRIYCGLLTESSIFLQYERVCQKSTETPSTFILGVFTSLLPLRILQRPRNTWESVQENTFHSVRSLRIISFFMYSQSSFIHVIRSFNFCPIATLTNTLPKIKGPHSKKRSNIKHVYI